VWGSWVQLGPNLVVGVLMLWLLRREVSRWWRRASQDWKERRPRRWKPKSPHDCDLCCGGVTLHRLIERKVVPYCELKSARGRKKRVETSGYACPNPDCCYCGITDATCHALVGYGVQSGNQRFKCQKCGKVFTSRVGTPLYYLKTDAKRVEFVLLFLAEGVDASVLVRYTGHSDATIGRWLERMGRHSAGWHDQLFRDLVLTFIQMDEMYSRVRRQASAIWVWLAIDAQTKTIPAMHIGGRTKADAFALVHDLRQRLAEECIPVFTTDGLRSYFYAVTAHFGYWSRPKRARKDHWFVSPDLLYGQLVKRKNRGRKRFAQTRMMWGKRHAYGKAMRLLGLRPTIQTAFVERVNLTFRQGVSSLSRRTWAYAQTVEQLTYHAEWFRLYYHVIRPHESLRVKLKGPHRRYRKRTPAMAVGVTRERWKVQPMLHYQVPTPP
jgi:IS1 family transposase/transposase-like protein